MQADDLADVVIPPHPCPPSRTPLYEWEAEARQLDHLRLAHTDELDAAALAVDWLGLDSTDLNPGGLGEGRLWEQVIDLVKRGRSLDWIAGQIGQRPEAVARVLARSDEDAVGVLAVERVWREHPDWSTPQIAETVGVHRDAVYGVIVERFGCTTEAAQNKREGGGTKYSAQVYDMIRSLRAQGLPYKQIAKRTGVKHDTVYHICLRHGWLTPEAASAKAVA